MNRGKKENTTASRFVKTYFLFRAGMIRIPVVRALAQMFLR